MNLLEYCRINGERLDTRWADNKGYEAYMIHGDIISFSPDRDKYLHYKNPNR